MIDDHRQYRENDAGNQPLPSRKTKSSNAITQLPSSLHTFALGTRLELDDSPRFEIRAFKDFEHLVLKSTSLGIQVLFVVI